MRPLVVGVFLLVVVAAVCSFLLTRSARTTDRRVIEPYKITELRADPAGHPCYVLMPIEGTEDKYVIASKYDLVCTVVGNKYPVFECLGLKTGFEEFHREERREVVRTPYKEYYYELPKTVIIERTVVGPPGTVDREYRQDL